VAQLTATLPLSAWVRHRVAKGAKGPREYEFARLRIVEKRHREPGPSGWMMVRRPVGCRDPKEFKYYLSNAPETISLRQMAWVGCLRWTIEENFELAKGELGLDHYELTKYRGWYHHVTLVLLALAFLKSAKRHWRQRRDPSHGSGAPPTPGGRTATPHVDASDRHCLVRAAATAQSRRSSLPRGEMAA
jgi:hypothetical protein